ncbi:multiple epidermal growth factor-like domains protein 6 [Branchiostoma lanceolatum]|uniref:multiple epidermal growth factor-like domains protein 6 n=1 Tax=Branchiostoma lanceolatum TaxID=7740 RepID=UPI003453B838
MEVFGGSGARQGRRALGVLGLILCMATVVTGVVDVTIVSKNQFFDESADTWLYCYHTGSLINQNRYPFGVEVNTGSGTGFTGQRHSGNVNGGKSVKILGNAGDFRVGAFSCQVSDGSQTEKAITFKMKSQADVWPASFTVTANTGDPVTLQMVQKSSRTGTLEWRKGGVGGTVLTGQNGLSLTIASVQSSDEGIYECYYQGDTERKQGIIRLIVRGCAENKWGPPSCTDDCPVCYNGGVCDDNTGECVCPPGFHGTNCGSACANDKIGTSCDKQCDAGDCTSQLLCVMDPYGCSCAPGLMGIECNTVCQDGLYGAGCTQTCHCANGSAACDKKTGACTRGCLDFWFGESCQIECGHCYQGQTCDGSDGRCPTGESHVCAAGYHGAKCDQECSGMYGPDCATPCGQCHGALVCDRVNGTCPAGGTLVCAAGYHGDKCNQECSGTYGPDCANPCGHCYQGSQTCNRFDGTCPTGGSHVCAAGYHGDNCDQACSVTYGPDCGTSCGHCYGSQMCNRFNGTCPTGVGHVCAAGYQGDNCHQECSGKYGPDCGTPCGYCYQGQACDRFDGTCPTGGPFVCAAGYHGDNCHQECSGTYGVDCGTACGHCYGSPTCDRFVGTCPTGGTHVCAAGYQGANCDQECPDGLYGADCTQTCHCANGPAACNKTTGACAGGCLDFWTGDSCHIRTATVSYEELFTKEEGRFFGDRPEHITAYSNIDAEECARRCLQGYGSYDGINPPCLSFNHRPAGSSEGGSARCWLRSSDKDTAASPGSEHPGAPRLC